PRLSVERARAGCKHDLEGAPRKAQIADRNTRRGGRIVLLEKAVRRLSSARRRPGGESLPQRGILRLARRQAVEECRDVKTAPAAHDGKAPAGDDVVDRETRLGGPATGGKRYAGIGGVDQVIRNCGATLAGRLARHSDEPGV